MKTKTVKVYDYSELSEEAKMKAKQFYELQQDWDENVISEAKIQAKLLGISIDRIEYSLDNSQGNGARFVGNYEYFKRSPSHIRAGFPEDQELIRIAEELQSIQKRYFYGLFGRVNPQSSRYFHENTTIIGVWHKTKDIWTNKEDYHKLTVALKDFMRLIYKRLLEEYEYQTSDQVIADFFKNNEFEFLKDGSLFEE